MSNHDTTEARMREAFNASAEEVLTHQKRYGTDPCQIMVGLESEVIVARKDLRLDEEPPDLRRDLVKNLLEHADVELGARQLELRTDPLDLAHHPVSELSMIYETLHDRVVRAAQNMDAVVIRCGTMPFGIPRETDLERTNKEKYQRVPDFQNLHRRRTAWPYIGRNGTCIFIQEASMVSLFQSFQVNLAAHSLDDGIAKLNYALMIAPYLVAASGNARFLACADTGVNDLRILAWERSHDTRTREELRRGVGLRAGLPEGYFRDMGAYLHRIGSYPFILDNPDHALAVGIGLHWLDARLKLIGTSPVVELRALSTQPSPRDEIALALWFVGRVLAASRTHEPLLPFNLVRENRLVALLDGQHTSLWTQDERGVIGRVPARTAIQIEVDRAFSELARRGIEAPGMYRHLLQFADDGPPSERLAVALKHHVRVNTEKMREALIVCRMLY